MYCTYVLKDSVKSYNWKNDNSNQKHYLNCWENIHTGNIYDKEIMGTSKNWNFNAYELIDFLSFQKSSIKLFEQTNTTFYKPLYYIKKTA